MSRAILAFTALGAIAAVGSFWLALDCGRWTIVCNVSSRTDDEMSPQPQLAELVGQHEVNCLEEHYASRLAPATDHFEVCTDFPDEQPLRSNVRVGYGSSEGYDMVDQFQCLNPDQISIDLGRSPTFASVICNYPWELQSADVRPEEPRSHGVIRVYTEDGRVAEDTLVVNGEYLWLSHLNTYPYTRLMSVSYTTDATELWKEVGNTLVRLPAARRGQRAGVLQLRFSESGAFDRISAPPQ